MSIPVTYLELLQTKPIPTTRPDIRFGNTTNIEIPNSSSIDTENEKLITNDDSRGLTTMRILDKRRSSSLNCELVMNKLRKQNAFIVDLKPSDAHMDIYVPTDIASPLILTDNIVETSDIEEESIDELDIDEDDIFENNIESVESIDEDSESEIENQKESRDIVRLTELVEPAELESEIQDAAIEQLDKMPKKRGVKAKPVTEKTEENLDDIDLTTSIIRTQAVSERLPKEREKNIIVSPSYYMNNRKIFVRKLNKMLEPREAELLKSNDADISCDRQGGSDEFSLLLHQQIVRDYLNLYTPYRGLLLYHGLGSGKTCTSIAISEGMKSSKQVFVLTPASLKMNFFSEMKKCGDEMYKKNQYWEFISSDGNPEYVHILAKAMSLPTNYINSNTESRRNASRKQGAWLINVNKPANYAELTTDEKNEIDSQLNVMIRAKYRDINYNAPNLVKIIDKESNNNTKNPFDNSVVVIDEAHNFVSRIVNKIKSPKSISFRLYDYLMKATNVRIVMLTGTPIINYPNEVGILYNILRGYIKTWTMAINVKTTQKIDTGIIRDMLDKNGLKTHDFVEYSGNKLIITRNPLGFVNVKKRGVIKGTHRERPSTNNTTTRKIKGGAGDSFERYNGVKLDDSGNLSDSDFINKVLFILKKNGLDVQEKSIEMKLNKCLPDLSDPFLKTFVNSDTEQSQNMNLFQRRILGLTSYFRSAQENLLPSYVKTEDGNDYHVVYNEMTDYQFSVYTKIRKEEADREKSAKKQRAMKGGADELFSISSTYRIFSRAACNFVFPDGIDRPVPSINIETVSETEFDVVPQESIQETDVYSNVDDGEKDQSSITDTDHYARRIEHALSELNSMDSDTGKYNHLTKESLQLISPKFLQMLENLSNPENNGLHLVYSHFRTMEGIGILRMILLANGFAEFKLRKSGVNWEIVETETDVGKPKFALYTGTETTEEREIIRNVYNGAWDLVPVNISNKVREQHENNIYGEVIKIFMITSSGAEGINLKNTRFVHVTEPYWHMVRPDQVVGRARRICSHQDLPEELRTVKVFLYVTKFSKEQKTDDKNIELRIRDISRVDKKTPVTTDETLYEIASIKKRINNQILQAVKESAVDCNIYARTSKGDENQLVCYGYGKIETNAFSSYPSFEMDKSQKEGLDVAKLKWDVQTVNIQGIDYILKKDTRELYDYNQYNNALSNPNIEPARVGKLVKEDGRFKIVERDI
jgi:hypothetical protein